MKLFHKAAEWVSAHITRKIKHWIAYKRIEKSLIVSSVLTSEELNALMKKQFEWE